MTLHSMKLVTVICEALAREPLVRLLTECGAHGYTVFPVEGAGAKGGRPGDIAEYGNIQLEAIVPPAVAEVLLTRLETDFFPRYTIIAHESDVRVLRPEKF
jgi:nitrogen regulatory protein PII